MLRNIALLLVMVALGHCTAPTGSKFAAVATPLPDGTSTSGDVSLSDQGVKVNVRWADKDMFPTSGILFDGAQNPVLDLDYTILGSDMSIWSADTSTDSLSAGVQYSFTSRDIPGTWRLVWKKDNEEIFNYTFTVNPRKDPSAYADLDCYLPDGRIDRRNFYQMTDDELIWMDNPPDYDFIAEMGYSVRRRAAKCMAPEYTQESVDRWEEWLEKLSGLKVRQSQPVIHERIVKVMPVAEEEFLFVNPAFVEWFSANMIPTPVEVQYNEVAFQAIYDRMLRQKVRGLTLVALYYLSLANEGLDDQVAYAEIASRHYLNVEEQRVMERHDDNGISSFITDKYETSCNTWVNAHITKEEYGDGPLPFNSVYMGFWLRRGIDGSAFTLWMALRDILKVYDTDWYNTYVEPNWAP